MAPIKSLKMSSKETSKFMNVHGALVGLICIAIIVAFVFWCIEVHHQKMYEDDYVLSGPDKDEAEFFRAVENRQAAFEGAVVGFLMIFVIVYVKNQYFPSRP